MKKHMIIGVAILILVVIVLGVNNMFLNKKGRVTNTSEKTKGGCIKEGELINFQLYKSYEVDTSGLRKRFHVVEGTPFTWFVQLCNYSAWNGMLNSFDERKLEYEDFEFEFANYPNNYLVVTFGRKLLEMKKIGFYSGQTEVAVTFDEEYHGDVIYFYIMDKVSLSFGSGSEFYVMDSSEKIYLGKNDLAMNEIVFGTKGR